MKPIYLIGAGIAAYLLLEGSSALGGGASGGGGGKKATAITGVVPNPGQQTPTFPDTTNPSGDVYKQTFQISDKILNAMYEQERQDNTPSYAKELGLTALTKKETNSLYSSNSSVSNVLSDVRQQGATVYTAPQQYDSRMVDYYVEIGGPTGIAPPSTKKEASTTVNYGGFTYSTTPTGGTGMQAGSVSRMVNGVKVYR